MAPKLVNMDTEKRGKNKQVIRRGKEEKDSVGLVKTALGFKFHEDVTVETPNFPLPSAI